MTVNWLAYLEAEPHVEPYISIARAWKEDKAMIERLRACLHGIASCSTCGVCRGAAERALEPKP